MKAPSVTTTAEVAQQWAMQAGDRARAGNGSLSYVGPILLSYMTPIAHIVRDKHGVPAALVLVVEASHNSTMTRHLKLARSALRDAGLPCHGVPYVGATGGRSPHPSGGDGAYVKANVAWLRSHAPGRLQAYRERFCEGEN